jgi:hypothetical protein
MPVRQNMSSTHIQPYKFLCYDVQIFEKSRLKNLNADFLGGE